MAKRLVRVSFMAKSKKPKKGTSKHTPKFTPTEREEHLFKVAKLDRKRWSQIRIAKELGVSQQQISYDLKVIKKRYKEAYLEDTHMRIYETRQQYNDLLEEIWDALEKSKSAAEKEVCEEYIDEDGEVTGGKRTLSREGRILEPAYAGLITKILKDLRELDGLDPKKEPSVVQQVAVNWDTMFIRSKVEDPFKDKLDALERLENSQIGLKELPSSQKTNGVEGNGEKEE